MSAVIAAAPSIDRVALAHARAAELAQLRAEFDRLSAEWNEHFRKQGEAADALHAIGERIATLERAEHGGDLPGYNQEGGAR